MPSLTTFRNAVYSIALLLAPLFVFPSSSHALTVENVAFADSVTIGGIPVPLHNAALLRYLKFINAYELTLPPPISVSGWDGIRSMTG